MNIRFNKEIQMAADDGNFPTTGEIIHANDILGNYVNNSKLNSALGNYVTSTTFNNTIGNINTVLDRINGEEV